MRRLLPFLVFFSLACFILAGWHYYIYARLVVAPAWGNTWATSGAVLFGTLAVATPAGMVGARALPRPWRQIVASTVFSWLGLSFLLVSGLGLSEIPRLLLASRLAEPDLSRAIAATVLLGGLLLAAAGVRGARGDVGVREIEVTLERLPASLSGYRMVQLSDLHVGPTLGSEWLERVVEQVNALEVDAVVITGDLVDGSVEGLRRQVAPLGDLKARDGVFFVTGNHEYYSGADAWIAELARLGIRTLRNERVPLGESLSEGRATFDLAGVDDWSAFGKGHGPDLRAALDGRDPGRELVLLAHQPRQIAQASELGVGLQLSGHTHGGQIIPWNFFVRLQQPYVAGLVRHRCTQLYVSRGTGYWGPPMRIGAPAEISLVVLRAPAAAGSQDPAEPALRAA